MAFSSAFAAAVATPQGEAGLFTVVDLVLGGPEDFRPVTASVVRFTDEAIASGLTSASGRVLSLSAIPNSVSARPSDLALPVIEVQVADTDSYLTNILRGRYNCRRSVVTIYWGHPSLAEADWYTAFAGILDDWRQEGKTVTLRITADDRPLQGFVPRRQLLKGWASTAPTDMLGTYLPIVMGFHDANGLAPAGQVKLLPYAIDASLGYKYVVSLGTCKAVSRVYKGSTVLTGGTGANQWTAQQETLGGMTLTTVWIYSPSPVLTSADEITADVEGLTDTGTTSGSTITSPPEILKWTLNNLIYGDWNGGAYLTGAPYDADSFATAASYCSTFRAEGARKLGGTMEQVKGLALVNEMLLSSPMLRGCWGEDGKIRLAVLDHRWAPYSSALQVADTDDIGGSFTFSVSASGIVSRVSADYLYGETAGRFWQRIEVQDVARWQVEKVTESLSLQWSSSRFQ